MKNRRTAITISVFLVSLMYATLARSTLFTYTGKFKVHNDVFYEQVDVVGQGFEWKQFDCIAYLENAFFDQEILNILFSYYQSTSSAKMPKAAFGEIAEEAMHSKYSREFYNRKTILENLHRNIRDILQKYSGHKTD